MRIAVVCPYDMGRPGGVQQLTSELVDRLAARGHDAWIVAPGTRPGVRSVGSSTTVRGNESAVPIALSPRVVGRVGEATAGADVVHVHEPLMPMTSLAALRGSHPRVVTFHAATPRWAGRLYRLVGPVAASPMRRSVITAVSPVAAEPIPARWGPVTLIPNAIDVGSYRVPVERHPERVTFLGRDDPRKGLDVLLQAWPEVRREVPDAEVVILGARREGALEGVTYAGWVAEDRKRALLASGAVHVAPNTGGESFGIVVAEGMAAGSAVVASDLPAFRDVVGDAGVLVPVGDPHRLAEAVTKLLRDPAERRRLGAAAATRAQAFDWDAVVDAYVDAYLRAI